MDVVLLLAIIGSVVIALMIAVGLLVVVLARRVVGPGTAKYVKVRQITATTVTLPATSQTVQPGDFAVWSPDSLSYLAIGRVLEKNAEIVSRELYFQVGPRLSAGDPVRWTSHVFRSPEAVTDDVRHLELDTDVGRAPAWCLGLDGARDKSVWAIHIHGIRTTRLTALRTVPVALALGLPSIVVSFREDGEAPTSSGYSNLGLAEWSDVDSALAFARANGAHQFVLFGWSMGAGLALQLTEQSDFRDSFAGLVLVAPATDWRAVIRHGVRSAHLPGMLSALTILALGSRTTSRIVGLTKPINFTQLDWSVPGRLNVPTLVIHSQGDREIPWSSTISFVEANYQAATLVEFPPTGHALEYNTDPALFVDAIKTWWQRTRPSRS